MRAIRILRHRLESVFNRSDTERGLNCEIELHIQQLAREFRAEGMSEAEAQLAARREFGHEESIKEECRDMRKTALLEETGKDLLYSLRTFRKSPVFATVVIGSLALGIGANTSIFALVQALLLRPLPVEAPERLVSFSTPRVNGQAEVYYSYPVFSALQKTTKDVLSDLCAWNNTRLNVAVDGNAEWISGMEVSGNYFSTLGVNAAAGRLITDIDDQENSNAAVAVISNRFWQQHLGGDRDVLGRQIRVSGYPVTIIGIMPANFFGTEVGISADVAVPLRFETLVSPTANRLQIGNGDIWLHLMGRLRPGFSIRAAQSAIQARSSGIFSSTIPTDYPADERNSWVKQRISISNGAIGTSRLRSQYTLALISLMVLGGGMLLLMCANVANLLIARSLARQREIAAKLALGASVSRLIRQVMTESLLLRVLEACWV